MERLAGRTAIVTGGGKGIGAAVVSLLAAEGAQVVAADIDTDATEELAARLGDGVVAQRLDVRVPANWADVVRSAEAAFGPVDILVNNAGIADSGVLDEWDVARLQRTLDVNLIGAFNGLQAVTASMRRAGGGSVVNIGSVAAFQGVPRMSGYVISKWGLRGLTKTAALELGRDGIRVNMVDPGQTRTPMTDGVEFDTSNIALGRVGLPEDIAQAVLFLASAGSEFITGTDVLVDGGLVAGLADYQGVPQ